MRYVFFRWLQVDRLAVAFKLAALACRTIRGLGYNSSFPKLQAHKQSSRWRVPITE